MSADSRQTIQDALNLVDAMMLRNRRSSSSFALKESSYPSMVDKKAVVDEKLTVPEGKLSTPIVGETAALVERKESVADKAEADGAGRLDEAQNPSFVFMPVEAEEALTEKTEPVFSPEHTIAEDREVLAPVVDSSVSIEAVPETTQPAGTPEEAALPESAAVEVAAVPAQEEPPQVPPLRFSAAAVLADVLKREKKIQALKNDVIEIEKAIRQSSSTSGRVEIAEEMIAAQQQTKTKPEPVSEPTAPLALVQEKSVQSKNEPLSIDDDYPVLTDVVEEVDSYISRSDR